MVKDPRQDVDPTDPEAQEPPRVDPVPDPDDPRKERVPAAPSPRGPGGPDDEPIGNGATDRPAAFPPHG